jgi:hypothetical protein
MRIITLALAMLALIAVPAQAQLGAKRHRPDEKQVDIKKRQIDEKAYKQALERIPEPKAKFDPWGVARPAEPAKQPK